MVIKKCLGIVGLEHFMTAATMELKLLERARRQCTAIFDETYSIYLFRGSLRSTSFRVTHVMNRGLDLFIVTFFMSWVQNLFIY
jgi:hypothetical protein